MIVIALCLFISSVSAEESDSNTVQGTANASPPLRRRRLLAGAISASSTSLLLSDLAYIFYSGFWVGVTGFSLLGSVARSAVAGTLTLDLPGLLDFGAGLAEFGAEVAEVLLSSFYMWGDALLVSG